MTSYAYNKKCIIIQQIEPLTINDDSIAIDNIIGMELEQEKLYSSDQFGNEYNKVFPEYDENNSRQTIYVKKSQTVNVQNNDGCCTQFLDCLNPHRIKQQITKQQIIELRQRNILNDYAYESIIHTQLASPENKYYKKFKQFLKRNVKVIDPDSLFYIYWQIFNCFIVIFYLFEIPFILSFQLINSQYVDIDNFTYCSITIFVIDILICFNTAYYNQGQLDTSRKRIILYYLRTYFILDILPIFSLIVQIYSKNYTIQSIQYIYLGYFQIFFFLKVYEIVKSTTKFQEYLQLFRTQLAYYRLFEVFVTIIWLCHIFGCVFHGVSRHYINNDCVTNGTHLPPKECYSWLTQSEIFQVVPYKDASVLEKYTYTFYWAVTTMISVGYGDITPRNFSEVIITICTMFVSCMIFAYSINAIWEVIREATENKQKFQKYVTAINRFMKDHQVNRKLQNRVQAYFEHLWQTEKTRDYDLENTMIEKLAPGLKGKLLYDTYGQIFNNFMKKIFSKPFLRELALQVAEVNFAQGELIFSTEQSDDNSLYYVAQGQVEIYIGENKKTIHLNSLSAGQTFGQIAFITDSNRTASARCQTYTRVYRLSKTAFMTALKNFEADRELYYQLKDQVIFDQNYTNLYLNCWICEDSGHICVNCPKVHLITDTNELIKRNNNSFNKRNYIFQRNNLRVPFNALHQSRKIREEGDIFKDYHQNYKINHGSSSDDEDEYSSDVEEYEEELNDIRKLIIQKQNQGKFDSMIQQRQTAEFKEKTNKQPLKRQRGGSVQFQSFQEKKGSKKKLKKQPSFAESIQLSPDQEPSPLIIAVSPPADQFSQSNVFDKPQKDHPTIQQKKKKTEWPKKVVKKQASFAESVEFSPEPEVFTNNFKRIQPSDQFALERSKADTLNVSERHSHQELSKIQPRKSKKVEHNPQNQELIELIHQLQTYIKPQKSQSNGVPQSRRNSIPEIPVALKEAPIEEDDLSDFSIDKMQNFTKYNEQHNPDQVLQILKKYRKQLPQPRKPPRRDTVMASIFN